MGYTLFSVLALIPVYYILKRREAVPCLMYHSVLTETVPGIISRPEFEKHMEYVGKMNTFKMEELEKLNYSLPKNSILVTFDDGYKNNYKNAFPVLKRYNIKATVFLNTKYIGKDEEYMDWNEVREMYESGLVDFQLHTHSHSPVIRKPEVKGFFSGNESNYVKREYFSIFNPESGNGDFRKFRFDRLPVFKIRSALAIKGMRLKSDFLSTYRNLEKNEKFQKMTLKEKKIYLNRLFLKEGGKYFENCTTEEFNERIEFEITENKRIIERQLNKKAEFLSYPWGHKYEGDIRILENMGIKGFVFTGGGKNGKRLNRKKIVRINADKIREYKKFLKKIN